MIKLVDDDKVPLKHAAKILGVSPYTLRAWVRQRRVPFFRLGRRIVFSRSDLSEHLKQCRVTAHYDVL